MSFQLKKKKGMSQEKKIDTNRITAGDLIDDKPEEVIDLSSIKELTQTRYEIKMPSFDDTSKSWCSFSFERAVCTKRERKQRNHRKQFAARATSNGSSKMKNKRKQHGKKS
jgi:hypothetical protein